MLDQQPCPASSRREFIRSPNPNDPLFGFLCQSEDGLTSTLGLYKFDARDDTTMKTRVVEMSSVWVVNLGDSQIELDQAGVQSAIMTRSLSQRLKIILATSSKYVVIGTKDGSVEKQYDFDEGVSKDSRVRLFAFFQGFGVQAGNKLITKKLSSSGRVDETYEACTTIQDLVDVVYDF